MSGQLYWFYVHLRPLPGPLTIHHAPPATHLQPTLLASSRRDCAFRLKSTLTQHSREPANLRLVNYSLSFNPYCAPTRTLRELNMLKKILLASTLALSSPLWAADNPRVLLNTSMGDIELELNAEKAPISVENFLGYVDDKHYDGTIFHRVIKDFMIQGGGFDKYMSQRPTKKPIKNEADNGLTNDRGTIAMARTQAVDSATTQWFINHKDNDFLNHGSRDFGYAVFGKVVNGMDVVDKIAAVPTSNYGMHQNVPADPVIIIKARRVHD